MHPVLSSVPARYTSKIIKAGALLPDTRTLLAHWDVTNSIADNLASLRCENVFGKASRARVEDVLAIFRQRYLRDTATVRALAALARGGLAAESLDRILFFYAAQSDRLLHDTVTEFLWDRRQGGRVEVAIEAIQAQLSQWEEEGKTTSRWSDYTVRRVAQGLMATLRDFGVLQGAVKKHLAPAYLPVQAFAFIAFVLHQVQPSGEKLIHHPEWKLFFLLPEGVERGFLEAHQHRLLEYHAAGSIIRIAFPSATLEEYAHVIAGGTA